MPEQEKESARRVMTEIAHRTPFYGHKFSARTITALVARGINAPERLLLATEAELKQIPGIGKAAFEEIMRYRTRFLPEQK